MSAPSLLLVRFAAIGDCVMAAWAATAYRNKFPEGRLEWAVESRCRPVIDETRLVTRVAEFPRGRWKAQRWSPGTWSEQLRTYAALRKPRFEWGLDLHGHSKTALCLRIANPVKRLSVASTDSLARMLNPLFPPSPEGTHTVERAHAALCTFADFELPARPIMPFDDQITTDPSLITISVGAGAKEKMWPVERWGKVGRALLDEGYKVGLLGGPDDPRLDFPGAKNCINKATLGETMNLVASSALHLSADTGTGHMAAAYGVLAVSIFGPTPPTFFRPYAQNGIVLKEGETTDAVSVEAVLTAARQLLAVRRGGACVS